MLYIFKILNLPYRSHKIMVNVLNVAEKNDAAKSIANIISRGKYQKREGRSVYNKIYEFTYELFNLKCNMIMTSVSGHVMNYEFDENYKKWYSCSPYELFDAPMSKNVVKDSINVQKNLIEEIKSCKYLIIWTDCDREGENIGSEIAQICRKTKANIDIYRAKFSEITFNSIYYSLSQLTRLDNNTIEAVDARQEFDLRIGASFTRLQTLRYQKLFSEALSENLISYGSCQFPTLGLVVERYKQIENFVTEPFWKIHLSQMADIDGQSFEVDFTWHRNRVFEHDVCLAFYSICMDNPLTKITDIKSKPKSKWRPAAMDTIALEKLASKKLRISAKETMTIAEKLYQKGYISYPRTETNIFPKSLNLKPLIESQTNDYAWGDFAAKILNEYGINARSGSKSDKAHPPIHPIKHHGGNLDAKEYQIYELVTRHFLACVSKDAKGHETTVCAEVNNSEIFTTKGLIIYERNYLDVYFPYESWNSKRIPAYKVGDTFRPHKLEMRESLTKPPPLLTESDLISLMERHGIGTDATHAEHIETIKSRQYVGLVPMSNQQYDISRSEEYTAEDEENLDEDDNNSRPSNRRNSKSIKKNTPQKRNQIMGFLPGKLGMGLVEGYNATGYPLAKPQLRSELEKDLVDICDGIKNKDQVLAYHLEKYKKIYKEVENNIHLIDAALSTYFGTPSTTSVDASLIRGESVIENVNNNNFYVTPAIRPCPACKSDMRIKQLNLPNNAGSSKNVSNKAPSNVSNEGTRNRKISETDDVIATYVLTCTRYPTCKASLWLPSKMVKGVRVDEEDSPMYCNICQPSQKYRLVTLTFDTKYSPPTLPRLYPACLGGCDAVLTKSLNLRFRNVPNIVQSVLPTTPNHHDDEEEGGGGREMIRTSPPPFAVAAPGARNLNNNYKSESTGNYRSLLNPSLANALSRNGKSFSTCSTLQTSNFSSRNGDNEDNSTFGDENEPDYEYDQYGSFNDPERDDVQSSRFKISNAAEILGRHKSVPTGLVEKNNLSVNQISLPPAPPTDAPPNCLCQKPALLLVAKRGANAGRYFYKCPNRDITTQCSFFKWSRDEVDNALPQQPQNQFSTMVDSFVDNFKISGQKSIASSPNLYADPKIRKRLVSLKSKSNATKAASNSNSNEQPDNKGCPFCNCGLKAILRQVSKDGPNKGKFFYVCTKPREQQCSFFLWQTTEHQDGLTDEFGGTGLEFQFQDRPSTSSTRASVSSKKGFMNCEDDDVIICNEQPPTRTSAKYKNNSHNSIAKFTRGIPPKYTSSNK